MSASTQLYIEFISSRYIEPKVLCIRSALRQEKFLTPAYSHAGATDSAAVWCVHPQWPCSKKTMMLMLEL